MKDIDFIPVTNKRKRRGNDDPISNNTKKRRKKNKQDRWLCKMMLRMKCAEPETDFCCLNMSPFTIIIFGCYDDGNPLVHLVNLYLIIVEHTITDLPNISYAEKKLIRNNGKYKNLNHYLRANTQLGPILASSIFDLLNSENQMVICMRILYAFDICCWAVCNSMPRFGSLLRMYLHHDRLNWIEKCKCIK